MKNILMNKKGFTLLEILVTVGIVGVLSAVAVPAYNQYKKGVSETAIESDIGNFQKAYMAYSAVHGTYCASFQNAGIKLRDGRNYAKNGGIGFATVNPVCGGLSPTDVQYKPPGVCNKDFNGNNTQTDCEAGADGIQADDVSTTTVDESADNGTWAASVFPAQISTACELDIDQLIMGAYTGNQGINTLWAINEEGKILADRGTTPTCPAAAAF